MRARCKRGREIERAREDDTDEGRKAANDEEKVICKRRAREYEQLAQMVLESQEDQTAMEPSLALLAALGISRPDFATNVLDKEGALHFHVIRLAVMGSIMATPPEPCTKRQRLFYRSGGAEHMTPRKKVKDQSVVQALQWLADTSDAEHIL